MIRKLTLDERGYDPGEVLTHETNEYTHITITYNVSGDRYLVDQNIEKAIEKGDHLIKVPHVNTTLYWQIKLGESGWDTERLVSETEDILKEKLREIFLDNSRLDEDTSVSVFCMVGNLRAFAFKLY
ncbi:hypothetical protein [Vibrio parahaemolyticus]|uniref:hypothetical protein n=1 Tax=Vibrio parahaemolyticus TaxID=670 RepID=UPI0009B60961|nr:hypothetical protein [Vibrio parahaemolyticus]OQK26467.1 hypothetical protein XM69_c11760 [Vibrio parahaemolyticus]TON24201.1 hypothetical protein CGH60_20875 [Vibrio parahaemolyticus]